MYIALHFKTINMTTQLKLSNTMTTVGLNNSISNAQRLALEFSKTLQQWLTPSEQQAVIKRNSTNKYKASNSCATHDFCDANEAMVCAFFEVMGRDVVINADYDLNLVNEAWTIARNSNYNFSK